MSIPMTLRDWSVQWIDSRAGEPSRLTVYMNKAHLRDRILPVLGDTALPDLSTSMVLDYIARRAGCGLSPAVVVAEVRLLSRVLDAAVTAGHIEANPCAGILRPVPRRASTGAPVTVTKLDVRNGGAA